LKQVEIGCNASFNKTVELKPFKVMSFRKKEKECAMEVDNIDTTEMNLKLKTLIN
jgi:hypothetical protein